MSFKTCRDNRFQCERIIELKKLELKKELNTLIRILEQLQKQHLTKLDQNEQFDKMLDEEKHYRKLYSDLPEPITIKSEMPFGIALRTIISNQFGKQPTQYVTTDPNKIEYNTIGVSNWRIPIHIMGLLLEKHPFKIFTNNDGYIDNPVLRFISELNFGLYWNFNIFSVVTETGKWVVGFWPSEHDDKIFYADPIVKEIWEPKPKFEYDRPQMILI